MATWDEVKANPRWAGLDDNQKQEAGRLFAEAAGTSDLPMDVKKLVQGEVFPRVKAEGSAAGNYLEGITRGVAQGTPVSGALDLENVFADMFETRRGPTPEFQRGGIGPKIAGGVSRFGAEVGSAITGGAVAKGVAKAPLFKKFGIEGLRKGVPAIEGAAGGLFSGVTREGTPGEKLKSIGGETLLGGGLGAGFGAISSARAASKAAKFSKFPGAGKNTVAQKKLWGFGRGETGLQAAEDVLKLPPVVAQMPEKIFNAGMKRASVNSNATDLVSWLGEQGFGMRESRKIAKYMMSQTAGVSTPGAVTSGLAGTVSRLKGPGPGAAPGAALPPESVMRNFAKELAEPGESVDDLLPLVEDLWKSGKLGIVPIKGGKDNALTFAADASMDDVIETFAARQKRVASESQQRFLDRTEREGIRLTAEESAESRPVFDEEFLGRFAQQHKLTIDGARKFIEKSAKNADSMAHPGRIRTLVDATDEAFNHMKSMIDFATARPNAENLKAAEEAAEGWLVLDKSYRQTKSQASAAMREFRGRTFDHKAVSDSYLDNAQQVLEMMRVGGGSGGGITDDVLREVLREQPFSPTWKDKAYTIWINALLTAPTTQEVNAISNTFTIATRLGIEKPLKSIFDFAGSKLTGRQQQFHMSSAARGAMAGVAEVFNGNFLKTFGNLVKNPHLISKTSSKAGEAGANFVRFTSPLGKKAEHFLPGTILGAADDAFKGVARRASLTTQASDLIKRRGGSADDMAREIADLVNNPSDAMKKIAQREAQYVTFTQPLGPLGQKIMRLRNDHWPLKIIAPFVRTPTNIAKYGFERLPGLGAVGNILSKNPEPLSEVLAKQAMGGMFAGVATMAAMNDKMTGSGPREPGARAVWFKQGNRPYSFKHNGKSYSFNRFEPFSSIFGFAADLEEAVEEGKMSDEKYQYLATKLAFSMRNLFLDKTYTRGLTDLFEALDRPDRNFETVFKSVMGSTVPSVVGAGARAIDPVVRQITDPLTKPWQIIQARLPWLSEDLPPKLDNFGDPIIRGGSGLSRFLTPAPGQELLNEKWANELWRLNVGVGKAHGGSGESKFTPEQLQELAQAQGGLIKTRLDRLVNQSWYQNSTDARRRKAIKTVLKKSRSGGRKQVLRGQSLEERRRITRPNINPARFPFES